jgi:hypothetical protein
MTSGLEIVLDAGKPAEAPPELRLPSPEDRAAEVSSSSGVWGCRMRRVGPTRRHSCLSGEPAGAEPPGWGCVALQFAICLLWAMAQTFSGVRQVECKDDSNLLPLIRFLEIQLTRGSKR